MLEGECPYCCQIIKARCNYAPQILHQADAGGLSKEEWESYKERVMRIVFPDCLKKEDLLKALEKGDEIFYQE